MPGYFPRWPPSSLSHLSTLFCFSCLSSLSFAFSSTDLLLGFSSAAPRCEGFGFSLIGLMWKKNQHTASFKPQAGRRGGGLLTVPQCQPCPPGQSPPLSSPWRQAWCIVTFALVGARQWWWVPFSVVVGGGGGGRRRGGGRGRGGWSDEGSCQIYRYLPTESRMPGIEEGTTPKGGGNHVHCLTCGSHDGRREG